MKGLKITTSQRERFILQDNGIGNWRTKSLKITTSQRERFIELKESDLTLLITACLKITTSQREVYKIQGDKVIGVCVESQNNYLSKREVYVEQFTETRYEYYEVSK